jgi:hypothetical protein
LYRSRPKRSARFETEFREKFEDVELKRDGSGSHHS